MNGGGQETVEFLRRCATHFILSRFIASSPPDTVPNLHRSHYIGMPMLLNIIEKCVLIVPVIGPGFYFNDNGLAGKG